MRYDSLGMGGNLIYLNKKTYVRVKQYLNPMQVVMEYCHVVMEYFQLHQQRILKKDYYCAVAMLSSYICSFRPDDATHINGIEGLWSYTKLIN